MLSVIQALKVGLLPMVSQISPNILEPDITFGNCSLAKECYRFTGFSFSHSLLFGVTFGNPTWYNCNERLNSLTLRSYHLKRLLDVLPETEHTWDRGKHSRGLRLKIAAASQVPPFHSRNISLDLLCVLTSLQDKCSPSYYTPLVAAGGSRDIMRTSGYCVS